MSQLTLTDREALRSYACLALEYHEDAYANRYQAVLASLDNGRATVASAPPLDPPETPTAVRVDRGQVWAWIAFGLVFFWPAGLIALVIGLKMNEELRANNADSARHLARNAVSAAQIGIVITLALIAMRLLL